MSVNTFSVISLISSGVKSSVTPPRWNVCNSLTLVGGFPSLSGIREGSTWRLCPTSKAANYIVSKWVLISKQWEGTYPWRLVYIYKYPCGKYQYRLQNIPNYRVGRNP